MSPSELRIALVGTPNVGKTSLFNALTGLSQQVGNYPGVTVERVAGRMAGTNVTLLDLPGVYSLYPASPDEAITCQLLRQPHHPDHPHAVWVVADPQQLRPSLLLLSQVADLGLPVLLILHGGGATAQQAAQLRQALGIHVVVASAHGRVGLGELKTHAARAAALPTRTFFHIPEGLATPVEQVRMELGLASRYAAFQTLLAYPEEAPLVPRPPQPRELIANELLVRYDLLDSLLANPPTLTQATHSQRIDRWVLSPWTGYVTLLALLLLIFQALFSWASYPMDWIDSQMATAGTWMENTLPTGWLSDLWVSGVWAGLQGILVFVPQIALLFCFIALLEESGYMARAVFLSDRFMRRLGLNGRSVVPLIGGFACAVPSIMATRTLAQPRERLITILITPLMSCSARIPVYTVLIGVFVPAATVWGVLDARAAVMAGFYFMGAVVAIGVALLLKLVLKRPTQPLPFLMELPPYRLPLLRNVALTIWQRTRTFVWGAGQVILVISLILWVLVRFGPNAERQQVTQTFTAARQAPGADADSLGRAEAAAHLSTSYAAHLGQALEPIIAPLGYDWKMGIALISSFAAREVFVGTMNTLYSLGDDDGPEAYGRLSQRLQAEKTPKGTPRYTPAVALSLMVFYALAMQCMSTLAVVRRETRSWKWPTVMLVYQTGLAYVGALLTYQVLS